MQTIEYAIDLGLHRNFDKPYSTTCNTPLATILGSAQFVSTKIPTNLNLFQSNNVRRRIGEERDVSSKRPHRDDNNLALEQADFTDKACERNHEVDIPCLTGSG